MESQAEFCSQQNISGASQQDVIAAKKIKPLKQRKRGCKNEQC